MKRMSISVGLACTAFLLIGGADAPAVSQSRAETAGPATARAFPHEGGVIDMMVSGTAAQALYERLPGKGKASLCGATGLHKGEGSISCAKNGSEHVCHIWIDAVARKLAEPEDDDC